MSVRTDLPRGLVTFMFTDIEGSTRLVQMLGEGYRPMLAEYRRMLRSLLATAGGVALSAEGDGCLFVFPEAASPLDGCVCAQRALTGPDWPVGLARPKVRMGLHTGFAEPIDREYVSVEVHRAARVTAAAHGGQVICSAATARWVRLAERAWLVDLGPYRLRGFSGEERLFQLAAPGLERTFPRPRADRRMGGGRRRWFANDAQRGTVRFEGQRWHSRAVPTADLVCQT